MRVVRLRRVATDDLTRIYQDYRDRDEPELAERLLNEAEFAFERLKWMAHAYQATAHTPAGQPIRRMPFRTLPYMFVYIIDGEDVVQIFACPHIRSSRAWRYRER